MSEPTNSRAKNGQSDLVRESARRGLSLTTLLIVALFFLGHAYWHGYLSTFGIDSQEVALGLARTVAPSAPTVSVLVYAVLAYLALSSGIKGRGVAVRKIEARVKGLIFLSLGVLAFVLLAAGLPPDWVEMFVGFGVGALAYYAIAYGRDSLYRAFAVLISVLAVASHAGWIGETRSRGPFRRIEVTFEGEKRSRTFELVVRTSDGLYVLEKDEEDPEARGSTRYFPSRRVESVRYLGDDRE